VRGAGEIQVEAGSPANAFPAPQRWVSGGPGR